MTSYIKAPSIRELAEPLAGLDSLGVFADLAAGRYASGFEARGASVEVKANHPDRADEIDRLLRLIDATPSMWD
ncbi:Uncharacterised protein (plasmid) [Tsukamurella tyrosinosolvens]|uniref:Uncharacterized protein n=1 Tax=Tsukamurella tyrosinosolvens TaxID=57704 RepID=A0A1H4VJC8_TSUTY|nr:hypothetical protein [Tsukamurella tyrosinosolvens]KXO90971.1 hypothetical protein AXK58_21300 [Tsukamurella tyrosinosolvens]SEC80581.1 hypothetical protein SAMN04489793_3234 [Tsukamurella tyrosinosolvens]VEH90506.1 Uncharacterised protein [Tsukamurella tyrosinosolvens]